LTKLKIEIYNLILYGISRTKSKVSFKIKWS